MSQWKRTTACILVPVMLSCGVLCSTATAQTVDNSSLNPIGSSDGGDKTNEYILIGLFAVVVGVLLILGVKSDRDWRHAAAPRQYAARVNEDGTIDRPLYEASPEKEGFEWTPSGIRARF